MGAPRASKGLQAPSLCGGEAVSQDHPLSKVGTQARGGGTCRKSHVCHSGEELWLNEDTEDAGVPSSYFGAPRGPTSSPADGPLSPLALGMYEGVALSTAAPRVGPGPQEPLMNYGSVPQTPPPPQKPAAEGADPAKPHFPRAS